ncbi:hypothetical protein Tco_1578885 [Tanacetum coccineum]
MNSTMTEKAGVKGARPLAGSRRRAPYWGLAARNYLNFPSKSNQHAMAEEDAFLVDDVKGGLCVDNTDARIDGRFNSGSNKAKGKVEER